MAHMLRQRPAKPDYETFLELQEELFKMRLEIAKRKKMKDLEEAIKPLKNGNCPTLKDSLGRFLKKM